MLTFLADLTPASAVALGLVPIGVIGLVLAFAPANAAYFDPRRVDESARALPVLIAVGPLVADARQAARAARATAAYTAAALLILTIPTGEIR